LWNRRSRKLRPVSTIQPRQDRQRHSRKYAEGELGEDKSFYFRGPDGALNLRAQNLALFVQMAEGIDDQTWLHHLRAGDYSRWLQDKIKDSELAEDVERNRTGRGADTVGKPAPDQRSHRAPLYQPRVASGLRVEIIGRRIADRDHMAEKLVDRGLPAEVPCI
jgi:hypothetical protein